MSYELNGKQIVKIDYLNGDGLNRYFSYGVYADGTELTEEELDELTEKYVLELHADVYEAE